MVSLMGQQLNGTNCVKKVKAFQTGSEKLIRQPKLAETIASEIRNAIINGELKEGDRLPKEAELISGYGVSRGVIREALSLLEVESFIRVKRGASGGGFVTRPPSTKLAHSALISMRLEGASVNDLYGAYTSITPLAVKMAIDHSAQSLSKALHEHLQYQRTLRGEQEEQLSEALEQFNFIIIDHCGNRVLQMVGHMLHRILQSQMAQLHWEFKPQIGSAHYEEFLDLTFENSEKLIQLVTASHAVEAEKFWSDHMCRMGRLFFSIIGDNRPLD